MKILNVLFAIIISGVAAKTNTIVIKSADLTPYQGQMASITFSDENSSTGQILAGKGYLDGDLDFYKHLLAQYPVLRSIGGCESSGSPKKPLRQFDDEGNVVNGWVNKMDIGAFQINIEIHREELKKLGLDVFKAKDNAKFAEILYKRNGTQDWNWSKSCWQTKTAPLN